MCAMLRFTIWLLATELAISGYVTVALAAEAPVTLASAAPPPSTEMPTAVTVSVSRRPS